MKSILPWRYPGSRPLMLAPMQGLTNRALRSLFADWVRPDVMFTEFIRVRPGSRKVFSKVDHQETAACNDEIPLVVQIIGKDNDALVATAMAAQDLGAVHLNLNLGCPFGRMNTGSAGGALLKHPEGLENRLLSLRKNIHGSFSVKIRSGYDDPEQIFGLLPIFADCGIDFIVLHPRTVIQKYNGIADHSLTARVVAATKIPVIANGDVTTAAGGKEVMEKTGAAGLMLGRGAIRDPLLFKRLRDEAPQKITRNERSTELCYYITELSERYRDIFAGETQVLNKMKTVLNMLEEDDFFGGEIKKILRTKNLDHLVSEAKKFCR